ncbi:MAG: LPXTG cell wall anchor domain-containing protein [Chloroflexi bacterium]|nr:LPXTG cell wall anchor domain-containing protein [Chloroflexota bacterium]
MPTATAVPAYPVLPATGAPTADPSGAISIALALSGGAIAWLRRKPR